MNLSHAIAALLLCAAATASAKPRCAGIEGMESGVLLQLVSVEATSPEAFTGQFDIVNRRRSEIAVDVSRAPEGIYPSDADVVFQFPDVNGLWVSQLQVPGTFRVDAKPLKIPAGQSARVRLMLPLNETLLTQGGRSRLVLQLAKPRLCIASRPFKAVHVPSTVQDVVPE